MRQHTTWQLSAWAALLVCLVTFWSGTASAQVGLQGMITQIEQAREQHQAQLAELRLGQDQFEALLSEIDQLKANREDASAMVSDEQLRTALRNARGVAQRLHQQSEALRDLADEIAGAEGELIASIDDLIAMVEQQLRQTEPEQRGELLNTLMALGQLREIYDRPLPEVPAVDLDAILVGLEEETSPEEIMATVDELDDNERRLLEHLAELEEHIQALQTRMALQQTARGFNLESSLFEEGISSGRRVDRTESTVTPTGASGSSANRDGSTSGSSTSGGGEGQTDNEGQDSITPPEGQSDHTDNNQQGEWTDGESPELPCGFDCNDSSYSEGGENPPTGEDPSAAIGGEDDRTSQPGEQDSGLVPHDELTPEENTPSSPTLMGVGATDRDPVLLWLQEVENDGDTGVGLQGRMDRLRRQRAESLETLEELRAHRRELLERAAELEQEEGL